MGREKEIQEFNDEHLAAIGPLLVLLLLSH